MNPILAAALEVQGLCRERGWRFCFIGGLAVQRWGEPRMTQDVDVTILAGFGGEAALVEALLDGLTARREDAREFALRHRVALLRCTNGTPLDVALGAIPFEERAVARASDWELADGASLRVCSAEDLIVFKAFAGRPQDWIDIEGIVTRHRAELATDQILTELQPLLELKSAPESGDRLRSILAQ